MSTHVCVCVQDVKVGPRGCYQGSTSIPLPTLFNETILRIKSKIPKWGLLGRGVSGGFSKADASASDLASNAAESRGKRAANSDFLV